MKKSIILLMSILVLATSCEEVIDLDLNSSNTQIVIEGNINSNTKQALVRISESINFDESNTFPNTEKYVVKIADEKGNINILDEVSAGTYKYELNEVLTGTKYELLVDGAGKSYSSTSTLQSQVSFDSLIVIKNITNTTGPGSGKKGFNYEIKIQYKDPVDTKNYYRFILFTNGIQSANNYVFDDRLTDGKNIETTLMGMNNKLNPGDTIKIEMQCIDNNVFEYFKGFGSSFGKFQPSSTPANPPTNIIGAKLGYFNAHTSQVRSFILP